jgi:regulator of protease activity HflC (stomatin/prohibitin superfamily)
MKIFDITITQGHRGLLYRDGVLVEYLRPGRHRRFSWRAFHEVQLLKLADAAHPLDADAFQRLVDRVPSEDAHVLVVPANHVAVLRHGGVPLKILRPGRYLVWHVEQDVTTQLVTLLPLRSELPADAWHLADSPVFFEALVSTHERAVLFVDGVLTEVLGPGRHGLCPWHRKLRLTRVDMREQELQATGQELITADKVSLRLNLITHYRVVEPATLVDRVDSLRDAVYAELQIGARYVVAGVSVDELLARRVELAEQMIARARTRARDWGVEIIDLDIKDVILPGEMKVLMNQVIEAEKRAAAQVILRREEVAATRSLANTARLLESNPVLLRLKELETWKELAERIPKLSLVVSSESLSRQLRLTE